MKLLDFLSSSLDAKDISACLNAQDSTFCPGLNFTVLSLFFAEDCILPIGTDQKGG